MLQHISNALQSDSFRITAFPLAFLLGLVSAIASSCCTLPAMGMLLAYSGTRKDPDRKTAFVSALSFMTGTAVSLMILGYVAGFVSQAAQGILGGYWKLLIGFAAVLFGLAALKMLPLKIPQLFPRRQQALKTGVFATVMIGGLLGGGVAASSLPCNPGIFIVLGAAVIEGHAFWGMALMAAFSVGFSLPLSALFFGVSLGKASIKARKAEMIIRTIAGGLLVGIGFYLLATF